MSTKQETVSDYVICKGYNQYLMLRDNSFINSRNNFSFTSDFSAATGFKSYQEAREFLYDEKLDESGYSIEYKIKEREISIRYSIIE
jgi:hypothetical protein